MDGNRRWAKQMGMANPSIGHQYGAEHLRRVLSWCERAGVKRVTVFVCSTENLQRRDAAEVEFLMRVMEQVVTDTLAVPDPSWRLRLAGMIDVLPDTTAWALKDAVEATRSCTTGRAVKLAIGRPSARSISCDVSVSRTYRGRRGSGYASCRCRYARSPR